MLVLHTIFKEEYVSVDDDENIPEGILQVISRDFHISKNEKFNFSLLPFHVRYLVRNKNVALMSQLVKR